MAELKIPSSHSPPPRPPSSPPSRLVAPSPALALMCYLVFRGNNRDGSRLMVTDAILQLLHSIALSSMSCSIPDFSQLRLPCFHPIAESDF
ncbi:hypothetical protein AKJ16_DCAP00946 [Drosera capensis]